jgi:MerR family transcriptional regulator, light-induced transcriptional regulator
MDGVLRIGEFSRRVGVPPELLRAWERRYALLQPSRSPGGYRLYSPEDEGRVRRMLEHLARGVSAAEAAHLARSEANAAAGAGPAAAQLEGIAAELRRALDRFDDREAHAAFDRLLDAYTLEKVLRDAILPYLRELGERWERGEASVAQEHFASHFLRSRLLGLARGWGQGAGPQALLACAPGELHDLPLLSFGLALRTHGWRITYLGFDTPLDTLADTARELEPHLVVVTTSSAERLQDAAFGLAQLAERHRVAVGGRGVSEGKDVPEAVIALTDDPITAADRVALAAATDRAASVGRG